MNIHPCTYTQALKNKNIYTVLFFCICCTMNLFATLSTFEPSVRVLFFGTFSIHGTLDHDTFELILITCTNIKKILL